MGDGRTGADKDALTRDGGAQIDDAPADGGVVRAPDLAPLAGVERCRGLFFKRGMPPEGIHLRRIGLRGAVRSALPGPEELDLDAFCGEQALLLGHEPREVEDRLTILISDFLHQTPSIASRDTLSDARTSTGSCQQCARTASHMFSMYRSRRPKESTKCRGSERSGGGTDRWERTAAAPPAVRRMSRALPHFYRQAFQIAGLRNRHDLGMVQGLAQALAHDKLAPGIAGCLLHYALETQALDVVGTGKRHQHTARAEELEGAQVNFLVSTQGLGQGIAIVREGGGIEHDQIKLLVAPLPLA